MSAVVTFSPALWQMVGISKHWGSAESPSHSFEPEVPIKYLLSDLHVPHLIISEFCFVLFFVFWGFFAFCLFACLFVFCCVNCWCCLKCNMNLNNRMKLYTLCIRARKDIRKSCVSFAVFYYRCNMHSYNFGRTKLLLSGYALILSRCSGDFARQWAAGYVFRRHLQTRMDYLNCRCAINSTTLW